MFRSIIDAAKRVRDLAREGKWVEAWGALIALQQQAYDFIDGFMSPRAGAGGPQLPTEAEAAEFDAVCTELETHVSVNMSAARMNSRNFAADAEDPRAGIDPATIMLIIKSVIELIGWIRNRRNPTPVPPPAAETNSPE